jgi:hypothetical protein
VRQTTRHLVWGRRGRFQPIPLVGAAPIAQQPLPLFTRPRIRFSATHRGRYLWTPIPGTTPAPAVALPLFTRSRRQTCSAPRRARFYSPPWTPAVPVAPATVARGGTRPYSQTGTLATRSHTQTTSQSSHTGEVSQL